MESLKFNNDIDEIYIYTRVSTKKQSTDNKYGLICQKQLCENNIKNNFSSINKKQYFEDIGSSYKNKLILTEMKKLIKNIKPKTLILLSEASRLGRNFNMVKQILKIIDTNKSFIISVSENLIYGNSKTQNHNFIKKVIDAERESNILSLRIKNTNSYIRQNGGHIGKAPFGYSVIKNEKNIPILKENLEEFKLIDNIVDLSNNCNSYNDIADNMNNNNLFYKNKLWTKTLVKKILNKFYPEHININQQNKEKINSNKRNFTKINCDAEITNCNKKIKINHSE
jgi:DNA invertase Pin-like site-specific DNA recombinase